MMMIIIWKTRFQKNKHMLFIIVRLCNNASFVTSLTAISPSNLSKSPESLVSRHIFRLFNIVQYNSHCYKNQKGRMIMWECHCFRGKIKRNDIFYWWRMWFISVHNEKKCQTNHNSEQIIINRILSLGIPRYPRN